MPIVQYDVPLTYKELLEKNIYLTKVNQGQALAIEYLESENNKLINDALRLAADNDRLTDQVFESPLFFATEFVV
jgi:hypothetical protein